MDQATNGDWEIIKTETLQEMPRVADRVMTWLRSLSDIRDGFAVDQLTHVLQTAARAEKDGADDEMILAALCHDVGKAVSVFGHAQIAASLLAPYVSPEVTWIVSVHQDLQARYYHKVLVTDPSAWQRHESHPLYGKALQFVDEWDQTSFDPSYPVPPLEHYEPLVRALFAKPTFLTGA